MRYCCDRFSSNLPHNESCVCSFYNQTLLGSFNSKECVQGLLSVAGWRCSTMHATKTSKNIILTKTNPCFALTSLQLKPTYNVNRHLKQIYLSRQYGTIDKNDEIRNFLRNVHKLPFCIRFLCSHDIPTLRLATNLLHKLCATAAV